MANLLLIEDETEVRESLRRVLEIEGHNVETAESAEQGLTKIAATDYDVVITDLQMPGGFSGMEVVKGLRARPDKSHIPVILITAHHTTEVAIEATKLGAFDYVIKSTTLPRELLEIVAKAAGAKRLMSDRVELGEPIAGKDAIVGKSRVMQEMYKLIGRFASKTVPVLIWGEPGTGRELVARAIYQHGDRSSQPFMIISCVGIPETQLESELFGHESGALGEVDVGRIGRFEQADGGTVFLDEIGALSIHLQRKLVQLLQDKTIQRLGGKEQISVDVRLMAATDRKLERAVHENRFRQDLYYRLSDAVIHVPPLRDHREDIPALVKYFMHRHGAELGLTKPAITANAIEYLQQHSWPGNVRELENVVRRALLLARGYAVDRDIVTLALSSGEVSLPPAEQPLGDYVAQLLARAQRDELRNLQAVLTEAMERELYKQAMERAKDDAGRAAEWLGISRHSLNKKLADYGILTPATLTTKQPSSLQPPQIPDHELLRPIGAGGFGQVWLARNKALSSFRAIKIVYRRNFKETRNFEKEFEGIQRFEPLSREHKGFVHILHVGRNDESGFYYYIMELADQQGKGREIQPDRYVAETLQSKLSEGKRLPLVESMAIGRSLTAALVALHGHNLVHRDIKPSNIIFVHGTPKVADIGLVADVGSHTYVGTPPYIAPEGPGAPSADVFSLGIVFYQLLTGKSGDEHPVLPATFDDSHPGLFMKLNKIMLKATARNVRRRYKSALELQAALASVAL